MALVGMMAWQLKGYAACGICIYSIRDDLGEGKYYDQVKKSKYKQSLPAKSGVCVACAGWLKIIRRVLWPSWPSSLACAWQVETQIELMIGPLVDLEKFVFPIAHCICFGHGFKIIIVNSHRRGSCGTQVVFMSHCAEM